MIVVATLGGLAILCALAGPSGPLAPLCREGISETLFVAAMGLIVLATWISWPLARRT